MKTIGIVAEYNPFHLGHAYHIRESRRKTEDEDAAVVAVMSGDFVQRGEAAVFSKYARAEAACRSGADLVVELPLPWAISSAEGFAEGAVKLLAAIGVDSLSFGSETADLEELWEIAGLLTDKDLNGEIRYLLRSEPAQSYASARQTCMENRMGKPLPMLQQPNNILALEYLKVIRKERLSLSPMAVQRQGAGHDEEGVGEFLSAAELRKRLRSGEKLTSLVPVEAEAVFQRELAAGRTVLETERIELLMLSRLRFLREEDFLQLPGAENGLGTRLYRAVRSEHSFEAVLSSTATRRYPLARVRRLCLSAVLGSVREIGLESPPYARILAFNERGRALLHHLPVSGDFQILTKSAHISDMAPQAQRVFRLGADAHDFYTLFYQSKQERKCGEDWRTGPVICL